MSVVNCELPCYNRNNHSSCKLNSINLVIRNGLCCACFRPMPQTMDVTVEVKPIAWVYFKDGLERITIDENEANMKSTCTIVPLYKIANKE